MHPNRTHKSFPVNATTSAITQVERAFRPNTDMETARLLVETYFHVGFQRTATIQDAKL